MTNREGQIWAFDYLRNNLKHTTYFVVLYSDLTLREHHINIFYDTDGSALRQTIVVEPGRPIEEWVDVCRIV